jgi:shikimate kinase
MENKPTTEQLLELLKYYTADSLKTEQTKLTKAANQAKDVASGRLGVLFSQEEREILMKASTLMISLKSRVERAKEVRQQEEEAKKRYWEQREKKARQLINARFPLPTATPDEVMALAELYLALHEVGVIDYRTSSKAAKELQESVGEYVGRLKRSAREAVLYHRHDCLEKLHSHIDFGDIGELEARLDKLVANLQNTALPKVRLQHKSTLDFVRTQLAIETTDNVTRLKTGLAAGAGENLTHRQAAAPDNVATLRVGSKEETHVIVKAYATAEEMAAGKPGVTYGPMPMEKARPIIAQHEEMKLFYKLEDEAGHEITLPHD